MFGSTSQIHQLLAAPAAENERSRHAELTAGRGLEVRQDAGGGKGKGVFATQAFAAGELLFKEPPLAAIQHTVNRAEAWVCSHCFRFIGSIEQQIARQVMAVREAAEEGSDAASDGDASSSSSSSREGNSMQREAAAAIAEEQLEALAAGSLRLPHSKAIPLPGPVRCRGGCCEEWYCSSSCADTAWQQYHQLLCCGSDEGHTSGGSPTATASAAKGKAPATAGTALQTHEAQQAQLRGRQEALREFLYHADTTNDVFRLAGIVVARVLRAAQRQLEDHQQQRQQQQPSGGSAGEPGSEACWAALLAAWQPFAGGHRGLWWECTAAPPEAAADMRQLAVHSLELLTAALPPSLPARFPALLSLPVWGSIIGKCTAAELARSMFELNNLGIYVASPLQRWLQHLDTLPSDQQADAYAVAAPFIDALPEELPGCEGNAFYALHSCCNHSCAPNAEAFKRDEDEDGSAVILVVRDIQPGEEITLSYIDEEAPLEERREQLADYGFECACDKCAAEELAAELGAM